MLKADFWNRFDVALYALLITVGLISAFRWYARHDTFLTICGVVFALFGTRQLVFRLRAARAPKN